MFGVYIGHCKMSQPSLIMVSSIMEAICGLTFSYNNYTGRPSLSVYQHFFPFLDSSRLIDVSSSYSNYLTRLKQRKMKHVLDTHHMQRRHFFPKQFGFETDVDDLARFTHDFLRLDFHPFLLPIIRQETFNAAY